MITRIISHRMRYMPVILASVVLVFVSSGWAGAEEARAQASQELKLVQAAMCESINDRVAVNPAVVFSVSLGKVICFTAFDPVPTQTVIYHNWYRRDTLSTRTKLTLNPPRWATYSTLQLRDTDKGPWRVVITDDKDAVIKVLRFSVTD